MSASLLAGCCLCIAVVWSQEDALSILDSFVSFDEQPPLKIRQATPQTIEPDFSTADIAEVIVDGAEFITDVIDSLSGNGNGAGNAFPGPAGQAGQAGPAGQAGQTGRERIRKTGTVSSGDRQHRSILTAESSSNRELRLDNLRGAATRATQSFRPSSSTAGRPGPKVQRMSSDRNCPFNMNVKCDAKVPYRTADGTCNNLVNPLNGMAKTPMVRLVTPQYDDGVSSPRRVFFKTPGTMPSPRKISTTVHATSSFPSNINTHELMTFSQFIDHDLTLTPEDGAEEESEVVPVCCAENFGVSGFEREQLQSRIDLREECFPIVVPDDDPVFTVSCMNFIRSAPTPNLQCRPDARQQLDDITHYVDGSQIYGSSENQQRELRTRRGGLLNSQKIKGEEMLPFRPDNPRGCPLRSAPSTCSYDAGDRRNSENAALTSQHAIWLRLHNNYAKELARINPRWDDEKLFQETRKIIVGVLQHIVYKEWLPVVIGESLAEQWDLTPQTTGFSNFYEEELDVSILNVFSAAAFRFGHTLIRETFSRQNSRGRREGTSDLTAMFDGVALVNTHGVDSFARGLISDNAESYDRFCAPGVRDHLFNEELDLFALNINRGRDHGLGSYNDFRRVLQQRVARDYSSLGNTHDRSSINALRKVYPDVEDIEIWPGGLSERHVEGGVVGPTFANIIALQFFKLKYGDRFWYEREDPITGFTEDQLTEIRKMSSAAVTCATVNIREVQRESFKMTGSRNPKISCRRHPQIDLSKWKEGSKQDYGDYFSNEDYLFDYFKRLI